MARGLAVGCDLSEGDVVMKSRLPRRDFFVMRRFLFFMWLFSFLFIHVANAAVVTFPDPGLDAAVRAAISKPTGDILDTDLVGTGFIQLNAFSRSISNLTGLEYCTDLTSLNLSSNLPQA